MVRTGKMSRLIDYCCEPDTDVSDFQKHLEQCPETELYEKTQGGWNVLHSACWNGLTQIVELLLKWIQNKYETRSSLINEKTNVGWTILYCACLNIRPDVVKLLLKWIQNNPKTGQSLFCQKTNNGLTVLHSFCSNGSVIIAKLLLSYPLSSTIFNEKNTLGCNILNYAFLYGHTDIIKLLLKHPLCPSIIKEKGAYNLDIFQRYDSNHDYYGDDKNTRNINIIKAYVNKVYVSRFTPKTCYSKIHLSSITLKSNKNNTSQLKRIQHFIIILFSSIVSFSENINEYTDILYMLF